MIFGGPTDGLILWLRNLGRLLITIVLTAVDSNRHSIGQKRKGGADFSKLRKWTRGTNIFEKDYLFVPIHDK